MFMRENRIATHSQTGCPAKCRGHRTARQGHDVRQLRAARHRGDSRRFRRAQRHCLARKQKRHGALESRRDSQRPRSHRRLEKCRLRGEGNSSGCLRRKLLLHGGQAQEMAMEFDPRHRRHRAFDDWRMGLQPCHDAVVPMAFVRARRRGPDFCRRAILSRRVEPSQDRQFQHGHARRARLHGGVWLQRVGVVDESSPGSCGFAKRRRRSSVFHGSRRHHHAHQPRPLARSPRERQGKWRVAITAQPRAANRTENCSIE